MERLFQWSYGSCKVVYEYIVNSLIEENENRVVAEVIKAANEGLWEGGDVYGTFCKRKLTVACMIIGHSDKNRTYTGTSVEREMHFRWLTNKERKH